MVNNAVKPLTVCIIMGVSGSGKTTIGAAVSAKMDWSFVEADDYHPKENIDKMSQGMPLTDEDRWPWLSAIHQAIQDHLANNRSVVVVCSALKESYRKVIQGELDAQWFYLKGTYELIYQRMQARAHFMKPEMLKSQFETLQEPTDAFILDIHHPKEYLIKEVVQSLS
ncbi:MAG: gluconokinase, GntK/IdnK-type [Bacteroidota bacterium]